MDTKIDEVKREIKKVQEQVDRVDGEIKKVEEQIDRVDGQLTQAAKEDNVAYLRKKEEQLQEKKLLLLKIGTTVEETSPKRQRVVPILGDAIPVNFKSEDCDIGKWEIATLVSTAGMSKVMEKFSGFPAKYYVRQEKIYMFERILSHWEGNCSKAEAELKQFAIVGSPGVGKSAFIVFLAFYMARFKSRSVLLLCRVKGAGSMGVTCVVLSQDHYRKVALKKVEDVGELLESLRKKTPDLLFFMDGFSHEQIDKTFIALTGYHMLATSSPFKWKSDDPSQPVVLPTWQFCDLKDFAWKSKIFEPGVDAEEGSRTHYYYSSGSLREFSGDLRDLWDRVEGSLWRVKGTAYALTLMGEDGGTAENQVDSLRRRYLTNPKDKEQYNFISTSRFVVDSSYALRRLLRQCDKKQYEQMYNFAKPFGEAFHGWTFEAYLHKLARSGGFTIQAKKYRSDNPREQYEIKCSEPTSEGTSESACKTSLRNWASNVKSNYWYPKYSRFPNIDSVAKAVRKTTGDPVIAYIQITIGETHELDGTWMDKLDEEFKCHNERIYIAIQPRDVGADQKLRLIGSPAPKEVLLHEAYFEGYL